MMGGFGFIEVMVSELILSLAMMCAISIQLDFKLHLHEVWQHYSLTLALHNGCALLMSGDPHKIRQWELGLKKDLPDLRVVVHAKPQSIEYTPSFEKGHLHAKLWRC